MSQVIDDFCFLTTVTADSPEGVSTVIDICVFNYQEQRTPGSTKSKIELIGWNRAIAPSFTLPRSVTKKTGLTADLIAEAEPLVDTIRMLIETVEDRTICVFDGVSVAKQLLTLYAATGKSLENQMVNLSRDWFPMKLPHVTLKTLDAVCDYLGVAKAPDSRLSYVDNLRLARAYIAVKERQFKLENGLAIDEPVPLHPTTPPFAGAEIAFVDVETTGLDSDNDRITEISVQIYRQGAGIIRSYTTLVRQSKPLPPRIVELTGITDALLVTAPSITEVLPQALELIGRRTVAAFNADFDLAFIKAEAARLGIKFKNPGFCVMEQSKKVLGQTRNGLSLNTVAEVMGIARFGKRHRAESDAMLAAQLSQAFWNGKRPYGAEKLLIDIENEVYDPDTGRRIPKPKVEWSVELGQVLSKIDRNADCTLWTRDDCEYINIYGPEGGYGNGVLCRIYKAKNRRFAELLAQGEDIGVWVERPYKDVSNCFTLCFQAGEPDGG